MVDTQMIVNTVVPLLQIGLYGLGGLIILGGTYYYLHYVLGRKSWKLRIWELLETGKLKLRGFDKLTEKKILRGTRVIYWMKVARVTTIPPSSEIVQNLGKNDYVDYIRLDAGVYAPMPTEQSISPFEGDGKVKNWVFRYADKYFKTKKEISKLTPKEVRERFIYIPLNRAIKLNLKYDVKYDVDMMRMNAIDLRDLMWQGTQKFWEKYGTLIVAGLMLICILAIAVLSYEHIQKMASIQVTQCGESVKQGIVEAYTHINQSTPLA